MVPVNIRYNTQKGVEFPNPRLSNRAFIAIDGKSVVLNPAPNVYAPALNNKRCQGIRTVR